MRVNTRALVSAAAIMLILLIPAAAWAQHKHTPSAPKKPGMAGMKDKMASAGADWATNPATQITWGLGYIEARYGDPCGAWAHSQASISSGGSGLPNR